MSVAQDRQFYRMSGRKLRRARRLWVRIIFEACWEGGGSVVLAAAIKGMESGLWAKSNSKLSVCFSITHHMFALYKQANPGQYDQSWGWNRFWDHHEWLFTVQKEFLGRLETYERWGYGRCQWTSRIEVKKNETATE